MKKLMLLITVVFFSSCSVMPYMSYVYSIDYSKYTDIGFFITESNSVNFEYDPVASVGSKESSGFIKTKTDNNKIRNNFKRSTANDALQALVYESIKQGGDALIGLRILQIGTDQFPEYTASGMAVKRK